MSHVYLYELEFFIDSLDEVVLSDAIPRRLLDIVIKCQDGVVMASSHFLAANSIVFEKMLFSAVQMEESITNIVHLDNVLMAEMDLLVKFYQVRLDSRFFFDKLTHAEIVPIISIAHRFEFTVALKALSLRLVEVINVPTSAQIQFADQLDLLYVLENWSINCISAKFYLAFVTGLAEFPLSVATVHLFATAHHDATERMRQPQCMLIIFGFLFLIDICLII